MRRCNQALSLIGLGLLLFWLGCKSGQQVVTDAPRQPKSELSALPTIPADQRLPALLSKADGDTSSRPMRLQALKVHVDVSGLVARTTLDMTFYNPLDQVLEGQFFVPLADGQQIARFAMEVGQELREAVVVPKTQARIAYESTTRRNIDPGLLEWAAGNTFRARIFPIPARGSKRVVVAIESILESFPEGDRYLWPLAATDTLEEFSLDIQINPQALTPQLLIAALPDQPFQADSAGFWRYTRQAKELYLRQQVGFLLPRAAEGPQVWLEKDEQGQVWFLAKAQPELYQKESPVPRELGILWDVSHSARRRDTATEIAFLEAYLQQSSPQAITVYPFHAAAMPSRRFGAAEVADLIEYLRQMPFDGATDLGSLQLDQSPAEAYLLFSDGLSNLGPGRLELPQTPVTVLHSSSEVDLARLDRIATLSGGHRIDLARTDQEQALEQLAYQPFRFLGASYDASAIAEVFPQGPSDLRGPLFLTGKLEASDGELALRFGYGQTITQTIRLNLEAEQAHPGSGLIPRRWAHQHIAALNPDYRRYADSIESLGQRFGIPTRQTSLLVLDALEDYVSFRIQPPPHMLEAYVSAVEAAELKKRTELLTHLDQVVEQWETRKIWWESDYEIPPGLFQPDPAKKSMSEAESAGSNEDDAYADADAASDFSVLSREEAPASPPREAAPDATGIRIKAWEPQSAYIDSLQAGLPADWFAIYLHQKLTFGSQPGFYLDVARFFQQKELPVLAFRVLSNLAELGLGDHELLRVLGRQLQQYGQLKTAEFVFASVLELRPEEPQSYRDLGLVLADMGQYQAAIEYLYEVVRQPWDSRFPEIGLLSNHELNAIIGQSPNPLNLSGMDTRLRAELPTDLRVVLDWDTDKVDMDLWVTDPRQEKCYYAHDATAIGGQISADFTGGYGPEEFLIKEAMPGSWKVQVNYYGARAQRLTGPVHIQVRLIRDYGRPNETVKAVTLRLAKESEVLEIGEILVE